MDSSEKRVLAVSGHEQLPIDLNSCGQELNKEIVNQYGQLMGEYSKLDDELWLTAPEDEEAMGFCHEGLEWKIVSSHPLEHSADRQLSEHADNSLTGGGMTSMNHSSQNQSCSFSPVSILKRKSFSNEATFVMKRGQSKHRHPAKECSRFRSANCSCPNSLVRTRKITDLLQLHSEEKSPNPNPEKIRQQNPQTELVKKCSRCDSAKTPQWRDGPMGRKTLCNACGIQYKKGLLSAYYRPLTTLKPQTPVVKTCVHCESAITPQWRDSPLGRKTLCNACGIQYKKGLLSPDYRPLTTLKPQTQVVKKCVHCESAITPQWRDGPLGRKTLCNACGIHYKKGLLSPDYRPMRTPRFDTSLPTHLPMDSAKNPFFDPYQKKVQEMIMAENSEIDHNCARKSKIIQDMTEETSDMLDSDSNSDPDFKLTPRRKLPKVGDKKCAHCQSTKTPQWREGPLGRKTLCNACGVQYRNGRLFPEYRPLQSPTYDPSVHSHLPKRVEQMRMRKLCEERATSEKIEHPA